MNFGQFLAVLRARKWLALIVLALTVSTTVAVSLILPKQYVASASVVIDARSDPVSLNAGNIMMAPTFMATQLGVIQSERVALRVIRELKLNENAALRSQWQAAGGQGTFEQWLVDFVQRQLDVKPSRESNVMTVTYTSGDPRFSAGMANAFIQAYIQTTLELRAIPARNFNNLFEEQTREARTNLERAQSKLSAFQQEKGIIATDERFDVENARLNELSSQLTQLQALSADSSSRQNQAMGGQGDRLQEVLNNPLIAQLRADVSRSEAKLQELNARLGDNHPQVVEAKANIAELRQRIETETRRITSGVGVTNTINRSREAQTQRELASQRARVLQMKAVRDEGVLLQRDLESAQRIYENLSLRQNQSLLESQNSQSFAHQLSVAQPPWEHASPKIVTNILLSVLLGGLLAGAAVLVLELADRRVRSADDVLGALNLAVLGTLPSPKAKRYVAGNRSLLAAPSVLRIEGQEYPAHGA